MSARPIKVSFVADTADLRSDIKKVEAAFESAGGQAKASGQKIDGALDSTAGHADDVASKGAQAAGALSGLGGLVGGKFGAALLVGGTAFQAFADAGDLVNVVTESAIVKKAKDIVVTAGQTVATAAHTVAQYAAATAAKVWAGAQYLLNLALDANPIGLIVLAIVALVAAFVIAYKKSDEFREIVDKAFAAIQNVVSVVLPIVTAIIKTEFEIIKAYVKVVWAIIKNAVIDPIQAVVAFVKPTISDLADKIGETWTSIKNKTTNAFDGVKDAVVGPFQDVVAFIKGVPGKIADLGADFKAAGEGVMSKIIDGISGAAGFVGDIAAKIASAVRASLNAAIDKINAGLEFTIPIPGAPDIHINPPDIPHLARGGVTNGPTLAVIGDNPGGREAVVPLNRNSTFTDLIRDTLSDLLPASHPGYSAPLIGNVTMSPGESAETFAARVGDFLRTRG